GKVPTVYEAMLAYRAVEQTPGVRTIHDKLEFAVPDDDHKSPLLAKGRPSDVESYAAAQIRRQFGDQAHVDRVRLSGGALEVEGTLARAEDAARIEAILRSMPVLRGFKLEPQFHAD
ncbi:MAG: BON domain-containing protein, partial [Planctomycetota bacterium]|nr:BON domain-containing protein [Planctomycetota bacterium]